MPIDFDEADLDQVIEQSEQPETAASVAPSVVQSDDDLEEQMSEVEARLEVASYYRALLNESLFDDPANPDVAQRVETEIRGFIRTRMQALMGVAMPEKTAPKLFTDGEVLVLRTLAQSDVSEALKALAAKVLKKPAILNAKPIPTERKPDEPVREPTLRKVRRNPAPRQSAPAPQPQQPAARGGSKPLKKQIQTLQTTDGREIQQDITPQARPTGPLQPIPTPRSREAIEAHYAQQGAMQARVALRAFEKDFTGK